MISETLKLAIHAEYYEHGQCRHQDAAHCQNLILLGAMWKAEEEIDSEEDLQEAITTLLDASLSSLIMRGFIEPGGMNEDGEFTYEITEQGKAAVESFEEDREDESDMKDMKDNYWGWSGLL